MQTISYILTRSLSPLVIKTSTCCSKAFLSAPWAQIRNFSCHCENRCIFSTNQMIHLSTPLGLTGVIKSLERLLVPWDSLGLRVCCPSDKKMISALGQKKKLISNLHLTTKGNCCRCASIKKHLNLAEKFNRRFRKAKFSSFICAFNPSRRFTETFGPVCKLRAVLDGFYDSFQALACFTTQTNLNLHPKTNTKLIIPCFYLPVAEFMVQDDARSA